MTIDYRVALGQMRQRRLGEDAISIQKAELYESRGKYDATRYALGAMQEVDPEYTRISLEEGGRVKEHLNGFLQTLTVFRYQGSVPLNIHLRRNSDIDLLIIHNEFFRFDSSGAKAVSYEGGFDGLSAMIKLRKDWEESLTSRYYAAKIDISGAKSIALSEGSFRRKIDVVPANWYDTKAYQQFPHEYNRDIQVLNKHTHESIKNSPFQFRHKVEAKDAQTQGGIKKVIRMLKNIKNDSPRKNELFNYDVTSLVWHMPNEKLNMPSCIRRLFFWPEHPDNSHKRNRGTGNKPVPRFGKEEREPAHYGEVNSCKSCEPPADEGQHLSSSQLGSRVGRILTLFDPFVPRGAALNRLNGFLCVLCWRVMR